MTVTGYLSLKCETCDQFYPPLVSTVPGELSSPDFDRVAEQIGSIGAERLRQFFSEHMGHRLMEVVLP